MIMVPPSPWKTATTRTLLIALVVAIVAGLWFFFLVRNVFSDASRPISEDEKEKFWIDLSATQAKKHMAEMTNKTNCSGTTQQQK